MKQWGCPIAQLDTIKAVLLHNKHIEAFLYRAPVSSAKKLAV